MKISIFGIFATKITIVNDFIQLDWIEFSFVIDASLQYRVVTLI